MSPMQIEEISTRAKALDNEEREIIVKTFPTKLLINEVNRRHIIIENTFKRLFDIIDDINDQSTFEEIEIAINNCRKVLKENDNE